MVGKGVIVLRNQFTVSIADETSLIFSLNEKIEHDKMNPAGQLIVDSDNPAFVYLVDLPVGYGYIRFEPTVWPALVQVLERQQDPQLQLAEQIMLLPQFFEELHMLVYNIEGNGNYGNAFVEAVEQTFAPILQQAQ